MKKFIYIFIVLFGSMGLFSCTPEQMTQTTDSYACCDDDGDVPPPPPPPPPGGGSGGN
ncbi:hypothetical protein J1N09_14855 [Aureitalea sp. L0-47]|uniref:hypothetical protein n=1 Tax=Aureitalea sp. L0-47 TaxID=2816962 RepID=UPI002236F96E|nr:hypothetical protein [Aureitalea sp. L0-47]MCW5521126.1 hypothetical protein [Aureitalea sp. L0-47]